MPAQGLSTYESGAWEIDFARRELRLRGKPVPLGGRAFDIVEVLIQSAGEIVTKDDLMSRVWPDLTVGDNTLQVHVWAVRKALGADRWMLKTATGRGYRLLGDWWGGQQSRAAATVAPTRSQVRLPQTNLPAAVADLIGRDAAVRQLRDVLSAYRIVTLTGPGGIGKSTLALQVARGVIGDFADGGWLVELASLSDPGLVPSAVAQVLRLELGGGDNTAETVARAIGDRHLLLILDNCEHLIDAVAILAEMLLRLCPRVTVLATSREVLRTQGEYVYRVPPLVVPAPGVNKANEILGHSAPECFIARAKELGSDFSSNAANLVTIAAICRHLDGIPLAIEFAAARAAALGIEPVAAGLRDRLALLIRGRRTALPRHRTLRATLDWSYELLPKEERRLLRCLAVFPAGFTLDAAVAVMYEARGNKLSVMDGIMELVAKSLVTFDGTEGGSRWRLLETIRAYTLPKLTECGEIEGAQRRHATYFCDLLALQSDGASPPSHEEPAHGIREIDNVRAALEWCFNANGNIEIGVRLAAAAVPVFLAMSLLTECHRWSERAMLALDDTTRGGSEEMHLQAAFGISSMYTMGNNEKSYAALMRGLELAEKFHDSVHQFRLISQLNSFHRRAGNLDQMLAVAQRSEAIAKEMTDPIVTAAAHAMLGVSHHLLGNQAEARAHLEVALAQAHASNSAKARHFFFHYERPRIVMARTLWILGYPDQAVRLARATVDGLAAAEPVTTCIALGWGAGVFRWAGDLTSANECIDRMIHHAERHALTPYQTRAHGLKGEVLIQQGEIETGVELLRSSLATLCTEQMYAMDFHGSLAQGFAMMGRLDQALETIDTAIAQIKPHGKLLEPELQRIRGELLEKSADEQDAERAFCRSIELADQQSALSWRLRASMNLARLQFRQGRRKEAREVLSDTYTRFSEGFDTVDLKAAERLLATLS